MIALLLACAGSGGPATADLPAAIEDATCAVCGMDVADQPAPRAQVLYRGGERRFACSIADLRVLLQTPSPLGRAERVWVEADASPPWIPAEDAWFVFGAARPEVMGIPALVFADRDAAEGAAAALHTRAVPWSTVRDTPFHQVPKEEE